jgi:hypothetical protein
MSVNWKLSGADRPVYLPDQKLDFDKVNWRAVAKVLEQQRTHVIGGSRGRLTRPLGLRGHHAIRF